MTPTSTPIDNDSNHRADRAKQVFLLAAFKQGTGKQGTGKQGAGGMTASGVAEDIVAVMGVQGNRRRFEWVGDDQLDSIKNPALVVPVEVPMALPSPWHDAADEIMTGLVALSDDQLGDGSLDDDIDHLLDELGRCR